MPKVVERVRKKPKTYITMRQRKAVDKMVENGGIASRAMRDVGYSEQTAKVPQKLTESKGFIALCNERGLTDTLLLDALTEDIIKKPQSRHKELELGFKVKGLLRETPQETNTKISTQSYGRAREIIFREYDIREREGSDPSDLPE